MILYPAIDVRGGKAVRLAQGDFAREKVYDDDPRDAARRWVHAGARRLHVVDLDGARDGHPVNLDALRRIAADVGVPVQFGGGLRSAEAIDEALSAGADRVILGTAALSDAELLDDVLAEHGERVVVSVDARAGKVATAGWTSQSELSAEAVIGQLQDRGVRGLVYSSIERDGTLQGPDLEEVRRIAGAVRGRFVYSGGIARLGDLRALAALRQTNLEGVIVGTALYEQRFTVTEAQAALDGNGRG